MPGIYQKLRGACMYYVHRKSCAQTIYAVRAETEEPYRTAQSEPQDPVLCIYHAHRRFRCLLPAVVCDADSGGENISSIEVETALHQHEAVLHVAVVAVPDSFWGEVPVAIVEAKPGMEVQVIMSCYDIILLLIRSRGVVPSSALGLFTCGALY